MKTLEAVIQGIEKNESLTIGEAIYRFLDWKFEKTRSDVEISDILYSQLQETDKLILRLFRPWPEWVINLLIIIISQKMSTLPSDTVAKVIRAYHTLFLEMNLSTGLPKPDFSGFTKEFNAAIGGHLAALQDNLKSRIDELLKNISAEEAKPLVDSFEKSEESFRELTAHIKLPSVTDFQSEQILWPFIHAKKNTFGEGGEIGKPSPAIAIYEWYFSNWPMIENLKGATELTKLANESGFKAYDYEAIKQHCRRLRIDFLRQGTS